MSDKNRFKRRRAGLRARGLCERCGEEPAIKGCHIGKMCASVLKVKKVVGKETVYRCEKIARLERNKALMQAGLVAVDEKLARLKAG
jgi:hypothetical protein